MAASRPACPQCGSSAFYEEDAIIYCQQGHAQEGGQQIGQDDEDYGRAGRVNRQKRVKKKQKIVKIFRGSRGLQLFLKAWQHLLWRQCHTLIHDHGLPIQLWMVVRELWTLRLSKLAPRIEEMTGAMSSEDNDLTTTSESGSDGQDTDAYHVPKNSKRVNGNPTLPDTIALNYAGIVLLRHPTRLSAIYNLIRQERIPYIRAIRHVPEEIRSHLAPEHHTALDTTVIPTLHDLQLAVYRTVTMYGSALSMAFPPINWTLSLAGRIKQLALPVEIFSAVKYLAKLVEYDFAYPSRQSKRRGSVTYPEAQLTSLIVVATKLLYPFDTHGLERSASSINEPAAMVINWNAWLDAQEKYALRPDKAALSPRDAIEITDTDVLSLNEEQLDQYMDWFQRSYVKDVKASNLYQQTLDMFPLKSLPAQASSEQYQIDFDPRQAIEKLESVQSQSRMRTIIPDDNVTKSNTSPLRPGQQYQQYRSTDEMSKVALRFHAEAAELGCLDIDSLLRACLHTEKLLISREHENRRRAHFDVTRETSET